MLKQNVANFFLKLYKKVLNRLFYFPFPLVGQVLLIMYTLKVLLLPFNYCGSFFSIYFYFLFLSLNVV